MNLMYSENLSQFYKTLIQHKDLLIKVYANEMNYTHSEVATLWDDLDHFYKNLPVSLKGRKKLWEQEEVLYKRIETSFRLRRCEWGNVLFVPPKNSIIPTLPIVIASTMATGNMPFILQSSRCPQTFTLFRSICEKIVPEVIFLQKENDFSIEKVLKDNRIDLLLYQGGSHHFPSILQACAKEGVYPLLEGSGQTLTIVEEHSDNRIKEFASKIAASKLFCRGTICSSPNLIFVPEYSLQDFIDGYIETVADKYDAKVEQLLADQNILNVKLNNLIGNEWKKPILGLVVTNMQNAIKLLNEDLNGTVAVCIPFRSTEELQEVLGHYKYGLQISLYSSSSDSALYTELKSKNNVSRITRNKLQVEQKSILPWGGYRLSGISKVQDYFEKFTKTIIIED